MIRRRGVCGRAAGAKQWLNRSEDLIVHSTTLVASGLFQVEGGAHPWHPHTVVRYELPLAEDTGHPIALFQNITFGSVMGQTAKHGKSPDWHLFENFSCEPPLRMFRASTQIHPKMSQDFGLQSFISVRVSTEKSKHTQTSSLHTLASLACHSHAVIVSEFILILSVGLPSLSPSSSSSLSSS